MGLRELIFTAILLILAVSFEILAPRQAIAAGPKRWVFNVTLAVLWIVLLHASWPAVHRLLFASWEGHGLLAWATTGSIGLAVVALSVLLLDGFQYWTHRALHRFRWLWWLHRIHHSDQAVDASTAVRHHPLEPLANAPVQYLFIVVMGVPGEAAVIYVTFAAIQTVFAHSNLRLPTALDQVLRQVVVTPDMHRIHHSVRLEESNSNFGMVFPFWDRMFGTYRAEPVGGHEALVAGVVD